MQADCAGSLGWAASPSPSCQGRSPLSKRGLNQMKPPGSFLAAGKGGVGCCPLGATLPQSIFLPRRRFPSSQAAGEGARCPPDAQGQPQCCCLCSSQQGKLLRGGPQLSESAKCCSGLQLHRHTAWSRDFFFPRVFSSPRASPALALARGRKR